MDINNIQQSINTRVVFREPRGMVRWLQLLFAIMAVATVLNFWTTVGINITCPNPQTPASSTPSPVVSSSPAPASSSPAPPSQPVVAATGNNATTNTVAATSPPPPPPSPAATTLGQVSANNTQISPKLVVAYPFDFTKMASVNNTCPSHNYTYKHNTSLDASPFFFTMTGILSLIYASSSLALYLFFSPVYNTMPVLPVADLIISGILSLFWIIASLSFSYGVSLMKSTATYDNLKQVLCPAPFEALPGVMCTDALETNWKPLNVGLVSGYTSFFLWGFGMWFVYKETHFHQPQERYDGPR